MSEADIVDAPNWPGELARYSADDLTDRGIRYADKFRMSNGWIYKAIGDRHPPAGILAVPDWAPAEAGPRAFESRDGLIKVRDHRWPDGSRSTRVFDLADVPLYQRRYEVLPDSAVLDAIVPEVVADRALEGSIKVPDDVRAVLSTLRSWAGVEGSIGLNGSFACGVGRRWSDIDVDVYGIDAIDSIRSVLSGPSRPETWVRRWPPDEQTNLYYVTRAAYQDVPLEDLRVAFQESGRDVFNFLVAGRRVSLSYHSAMRRDALPGTPRIQGELEDATEYTAVFLDSPQAGNLDLPAIFHVADVSQATTRIARKATVVSDSKAFGLCQAGDIVRFRAMLAQSDSGDTVLIAPSYGPEWPVWPMSLSAGDPI